MSASEPEIASPAPLLPAPWSPAFLPVLLPALSQPALAPLQTAVSLLAPLLFLSAPLLPAALVAVAHDAAVLEQAPVLHVAVAAVAAKGTAEGTVAAVVADGGVVAVASAALARSGAAASGQRGWRARRTLER